MNNETFIHHVDSLLAQYEQFRNNLDFNPHNAMTAPLPWLRNWKRNPTAEIGDLSRFKKTPLLLILATQRSGSTLLCKLAELVSAGMPAEHFNHYFTGRNEDSSVEDIFWRGTQNDICGQKIMASQVLAIANLVTQPADLTSDQLEEVFYQTLCNKFKLISVFYIDRKDFLNQVLSSVSAQMTKQYFGGKGKGDIDPENIDMKLVVDTWWALQWSRLYLKRYVDKWFPEAAHVSYENDLLESNRKINVANRICQSVGLDCCEIDEKDLAQITLRPARTENNRMEVKSCVKKRLCDTIGIERFKIMFQESDF